MNRNVVCGGRRADPISDAKLDGRLDLVFQNFVKDMFSITKTISWPASRN
jgi:hypothetical protein